MYVCMYVCMYVVVVVIYSAHRSGFGETTVAWDNHKKIWDLGGCEIGDWRQKKMLLSIETLWLILLILSTRLDLVILVFRLLLTTRLDLATLLLCLILIQSLMRVHLVED